MQNPIKVVMGHLNINLLPNKFEGIIDIVAKNIDVFLISETKIDYSFPEAQFKYNGYGLPIGEIELLEVVALCYS